MARVLLTGANGLLGHEVARLLSESGDEVVALGRKACEIQSSSTDFIEADLTQPLQTSTLPHRCDAVVHLAQCERFNDFPNGARDVFAVNVAAPMALLDWARGADVRAFVHASSGGLYGGGAMPFKEDDALNFGGRLAYYLSTKRATEVLAAAYQDQFAVSALRFFFIYGARQRAHMLMPRLIASVREGRALTLHGDDGMALNPVQAYDAAAAVMAAMRAGKRGVYNIGGPETVRIRDIGEAIGQLLGRAPQFDVAGDAPNDLVGDITRMRTELHAPTIGLREGLREMCA